MINTQSSQVQINTYVILPTQEYVICPLHGRSISSISLLLRSLCRSAVAIFVLILCLLSSPPVVLSCSHLRWWKITLLQFLLRIIFCNFLSTFPFITRLTKRGVREQDGTFNHSDREFLTNCLTLEPFRSLGWNHPTRTVVSDWPRVQWSSITLVNRLCFTERLRAQDLNEFKCYTTCQK